MNFGQRFMNALQTGYKAYRKAYLSPDGDDFTLDSDWASYGPRMLRYDVLWKYYSGDPYDAEVSTWARKMKADHGLYKFVRPIDKSAYQMGEFYRTYVWSADMPIDNEDQRLNDAIMQIYKWSMWKQRCGIVPLHGATMGDAFIEVVNDTDKEKVYLREIHPSKIADMVKDPYGNVRAYKIQYQRTDDENNSREVTYTENVYRDGDNVVYELYKNDKPYAWDGAETAEWSVPYGFVPMVHIQHRETSDGWGMAEIMPSLSIVREIDDASSLLDDQIRKIVNAKWAIIGTSPPSSTPSVENTANSTTKPQAGRQEEPWVYFSNPDTKIQPFIAQLQIDEARNNINELKAELERVYPELSLYRIREQGGNLSGRAVRYLQREAEGKVRSARAVYDGGLRSALQMAITIGGMMKYDGFTGFNENSYANGDLDFRFEKRPVFSDDVLDDLEVKEAKAKVFSTYANSMVDIEQAALLSGHDEQEAQELAGTNGNIEAASGGNADVPENITTENVLNGAQITSAVQLLQNVTDSITPPAVAIELLISLGFERTRATQMVTDAQRQESQFVDPRLSGTNVS